MRSLLTDDVRARLRADAIRLGLEHPFGVGWGDFAAHSKTAHEIANAQGVAYAHNAFAEAFAEGGLLALVAFLVVVVLALYRLQRRSGGPYEAVVLGTAVYWLLNAQVSSDLVGNRFMWISIAVGLASYVDPRVPRRSRHPPKSRYRGSVWDKILGKKCLEGPIRGSSCTRCSPPAVGSTPRATALRPQRLGHRLLRDGLAAARRGLQHVGAAASRRSSPGWSADSPFIAVAAPLRLHEGRYQIGSFDDALLTTALGAVISVVALVDQLLHPRRTHLGGGDRPDVRVRAAARWSCDLPRLPRLGAVASDGRAARRTRAGGGHRRRQRRCPAGQRHGARPVVAVAARWPWSTTTPTSGTAGSTASRWWDRPPTWRRSPTGTTRARSSWRSRAPRRTWSAGSTRAPARPRSTSRCCRASTT